jgi:hypothetical protein
MSIKTSITRTIGRATLKVSHNSPHILFGAGVIGVVGATVLACRATLKLEKAVEGLQYDVNAIKSTEYTNDERGENADRKDLAYAYLKGTLEITKLYAPAVAVGGLSLVALTGSHVQLSRRNTALTVAYTGLHQAYNEYRSRVRGYIGDEKERDLYHGVELQKVEGADGKKHEVKVGDPNKLSVYAKIFDESNVNWSKDPELNRLFITCQQNYLNHRLAATGHVFLNEVYDALGFDRTQAGQIVGWVLNHDGDNYIDFGMFNCDSSRFINGWERSIVLDFNVDGVVFDKI